MGVYATEAKQWTQRIGARHAASYLGAALRLLPRGRIPPDHEVRGRLIDRLRGSALETDPFSRLDEQYEGAMSPMIDSLRSYLRKHKQEMERWLAGDYRSAAGAKSKGVRKEPSPRVAATNDKAVTVRPLRARFKPNGDDPIVLEFLDRIAQLEPDQWREVARRYIAKARAIEDAEAGCVSVNAGVTVGRVKPQGRTKERRKEAATRAKARAWAIYGEAVKAIPETEKAGGKTVPLRKAATLALTAALGGLVAYHEIIKEPGGERARQTVLAPFEGL